MSRRPTAPLADVAIVGVHNTEQARHLPGKDSMSVAFEAAHGALSDAGLTPFDVDGVAGPLSSDFIYQTGIAPAWYTHNAVGIPTLLESVFAIQSGMATVVLVLSGTAGRYTAREATAPWTRPNNEMVEPFGMFTATQFALVAQRYLYEYGVPAEALATVAATIRNNGHVNPDALYYGKGPYTPQDILASRMIAEPYHLLDCASTSEGGAALILARADVAQNASPRPVYLLAGGAEQFGPSYRYPPRLDLHGRGDHDLTLQFLGRRIFERALGQAGLVHADVDVLELYDPFSFEIIRQLEAFGFCGVGEGGDFVLDGTIGPGGRFPVTTDGGTMSFGHPGELTQKLQRVIRGVQQLRGTCRSNQKPGAEIALCTGGGSGPLFMDLLLLSAAPP